MAGEFDQFGESGAGRPERGRPRFTEVAAFGACVAINWWAAATWPSAGFSLSSALLFGWLLVIVVRVSAAGAILLLPLVITRAATVLSLAAIEAGAYMPEIDRLGIPGDASASFVAATAVFFLVFAAIFRRLEPVVLRHARSPVLDGVVAMLGWPAVLLCAGLGAAAFLQGWTTGFPLLEGVDRFRYRRETGGLAVLLLDNKFLVAAVLGAATFALRHAPLLKSAAALTFVALTGLYFLFADKFFTILAEATFFAMPYLLARRARLGRTLLRVAPLGGSLACASLGATLFIYSDYGRLPLAATAELVGERVAGQGQLWFVATRDVERAPHRDEGLIRTYAAVSRAPDPAAAAFQRGVETYWFVNRYAPEPLRRNFRQSGGWVQLVMGTEAMALVVWGWPGVLGTMLVSGLLTAAAALFLRRAFESGFPLSLAAATWVYLQVHFAAQQASTWPVVAPGQINRLLLLGVMELALYAFNRGQAWAVRPRRPSLRVA